MRVGKRLEKILNMVDNNIGSAVDVGTDHGYLALKLLTEKNVGYVIATDISEPSLNKAKQLSEKYDLTDRFKTICSDGLRELKNDQFDLVVIAGMGGHEIVKILNETNNIDRIGQFILQPMQDVDVLRKFLFDNGFEIEIDETIKDRNKFYSVIKCKHTGEAQKYTFKDIYIGKTDELNKEADFLEFVEFEIKSLNQRKDFLSEVDKKRFKLYSDIMLDKIRGE